MNKLDISGKYQERCDKDKKQENRSIISDHIYFGVLLGSILVRLRLSWGIHVGESITSKNKNWKVLQKEWF